MRPMKPKVNNFLQSIIWIYIKTGMKTWIVAGMALLFGSVSIQAQQTQQTPGEIKVPWANKLIIPENAPAIINHQFGVVPNGTILHHIFPIKNIYAVNLQITDVRVECGCVSVQYPKGIIQPKGATALDLTMDLRRFPSMKKSVTVWVDISGPEYHSTAVLRMFAESRGDVAITPGQIDFGIVGEGQTPSHFVQLQYQGRMPNWQITRISNSEGSAVDAKAERVQTQGGEPVYKITASLKQGVIPGRIQEQLYLSTNDPSNPTIPVTITGLLKAPFNVSPNPVRLSEIPSGSTKQIRVMVSSNKPFKIEKIEGDKDGLTVDILPDPRRVQILTVKYHATQTGMIQRQLKLITDSGHTITLPVEAMVK